MTPFNAKGFTLVEFMASFVVIIISGMMVMSFGSAQIRLSKGTTAASTQNRIVAAVRSYAGSPPALRNSLIAQDPSGGTGAANQALLNCTGSPVPLQCQTGAVYDLILYSPILAQVNGSSVVTAVFFGPHSSSQSRFDEFGLPCATGETCPLIVETTFTPQCGPAQQSPSNLAPGTLGTTSLDPMATCSVADIISVGYKIYLDSAMASRFPELSGFSTPVIGSVSTSVVLITGNVPQ